VSEAAPGPGTVALQQVTARLLGRMTWLTAPAWAFGAVHQAPAMAPWWDVLVIAMIAVAALPVLAAGTSRSTSRWPAAGLAAVVFVAVTLWPAGVVDTDVTSQRLPWLWLILPLALAAVATFDSIVLSAGYATGLGAWYTLLRFDETGGEGEFPYPLIEWGLVVALGVGLALLVRAARSGARRLDVDEQQARKAGTSAAELAAAADARAEVDAVLHDRVLAALLLAVRSAGSPDVPVLAGEALAALERTSQTGLAPAQRPVTFTELHRRVEAGVRVLAPAAVISTAAGPDVPEPVARAIVEATAEAVRNSVRHTRRPDGTAPVRVSIGPEQAPAAVTPADLAIRISDDGPGFDPNAVPPERLGLAVSIIGRIRNAGGSADIESAPERGTTVTLRWSARHAVTAGT